MLSIFGTASRDIGIDFGTANTLFYLKNKGIVLDEPSVLAMRNSARGAKKVVAVGGKAKNMLGKTPDSITVSQPLKDGVISDFEAAATMLKYFLADIGYKRFAAKPRIVISVPYDITPIERRAVREAAASAGKGEVYLIEEPMAAAIGAGLPITEPAGSMIVDIGSGMTEVAVISLSGIVYCHSVRIAGEEIDEAIMNYIKRKYNLLIGEQTAEKIKIVIGSAYPGPGEDTRTMEINGRNLIHGIPQSLKMSSPEVREAIAEPIHSITDAVRVALERMPPELASDIIDTGITLSGGGSLLKNLDLLIEKVTQVPVHVADNPMNVVAEGAGRVLDELALLKEISR
ncbi:MAG TPA: rod shape-determining protein [Deltaproteobacteria bacterium]|nr:rod shape-determining protein [Deltaproteobacteria bacterium]